MLSNPKRELQTFFFFPVLQISYQVEMGGELPNTLIQQSGPETIM